MGVSKDEILACGMPALFVTTMHDNFAQKTSTAEIFSGAATFASNVTFEAGKTVTMNGAVTVASSASFNGAVTIGNATADTLTVNAQPTFASPVTVNALTTFNSAAVFSSGASLRVSTQTIASAQGTTLGSATAITAFFTTVASASAGEAGVALPTPSSGSMFIVDNRGGATITVYANGGATINGTAGTTGVTVAATKTRIFVAISASAYFSMLGA